LLGYEPKVNLEEGLMNLLEWVKDQKPADRVESATAELAARSLVR
jgi:dTDP-L-rhamnose 4-epimerase